MKEMALEVDFLNKLTNPLQGIRLSRRIWLGIFIIVVLVIATYSFAILHCGYVWDDQQFVHEQVSGVKGLARIWTIGGTRQYYPLTISSFWVEHELWRLNPIGYHFTNVLLHILNALLLWVALRCLRVRNAWLAAMIFAVHPVHVESVAWMSERKNLLSGFFYFLSLLAYFQHMNPKLPGTLNSDHVQSKMEVRFYYILSLIFFICSLLSKTVTCTLPAVLLLIIWWKKDRINFHDMFSLIPYFVVGAPLGILTTHAEKVYTKAVGVGWAFLPEERLLIAGRAVWFYLSKLFWPFDLTFSYPRWELYPDQLCQYFFPFSVVLAILLLFVFRRRIGKSFLVAFLFFVGTLFPALGFFNIYPMIFSFVADHFQYLASIAPITLLTVLLATAKEQASQQNRFVGCFVFGVGLFIVLSLSFLSWKQTHIYKNHKIIWRDTIKKNPKSWMAYNNLGVELLEERSFDEALIYFQKVMALKPDYKNSYYNLGVVYMYQKKHDLAIKMLELGIKVDYYNYELHTLLGKAYFLKGDFDKAKILFNLALELNYTYVDAYIGLGKVEAAQGNLGTAKEHFLKALKFDPTNNFIKEGYLDYIQETEETMKEEKEVSEQFRPKIFFPEDQELMETSSAFVRVYPKAVRIYTKKFAPIIKMHKL